MKDKKRVPAKAIIKALQVTAQNTHSNTEGIRACIVAIRELDERLKALEGMTDEESGTDNVPSVHQPPESGLVPGMGTDGWSDEDGVAGSGGGSSSDDPSVVREPVEEECIACVAGKDVMR